MTVLWGDTGKTAISTLKTYNISFATPRESLLTTPLSLPSTEPTTPQVSVTIGVGDLPNILPSPLGVKYTAALYAAGKNTDAAAQTVSWRVLKNNISIATGTSSSVPTNQFWTHSYFQFYDVVVGDVLEIKLWSASANVNYDYWGLSVYPTRLNVGKADVNKDVVYGSGIFAALISGTASVNLSVSALLYASDSLSLNFGFAANLTFGALHWNNTYYAFRIDLGDSQQTTTTVAHATARPHYRRNIIPSSISFREVLR
jgi:hypothetical protein